MADLDKKPSKVIKRKMVSGEAESRVVTLPPRRLFADIF